MFDLPTDCPRDTARPATRATATITLPPAIVAALRVVCAEAGRPLTAGLQAGFDALLVRYCRAADVDQPAVADLLRDARQDGVLAAGTDLVITTAERDGEVIGTVEYNAGLFRATTVDRLLRHLTTLLGGIAAGVGPRVVDLPMLSDHELRHPFLAWNSTDVGTEPPSCLHLLVEAQVDKTPDAVAVVCGERTLTYRQLDRRANQLAAWLRAHGVTAGDLVGVCAPRSAELVAGLLAVLKTGAAYLPLDPAYPAARRAFILDDADARLVLTEAELTGAGLDLPAHRPSTVVTPGELAYVIYTSGSTGKPKGVLLEHASVVNMIRRTVTELGYTAADRLLAGSTIAFDIACLELFAPLACGATVVVGTEATMRDGRALGELIDAQRATILQATPSTWRMLLDSGWRGAPALRAQAGGEALPPDLAATLLDRTGEVWNLYGPTEATVWSLAWPVTAADLGATTVPIGLPMGNTRLYVVDAALRPVPVGVPGELLIGGAGLARGYLNRPELTAERFVEVAIGGLAPQRLYRTGDLVRQRGDGTVEFLGRLDNQVKVRGFRIELGEVENTLARLPGVGAAVVVVRADRLIGYFTGGADVSAAALRAQLADRLPDHMVPSVLVRLAELPLTDNLKIDRAALPAPDAVRPELDVPFRAPATDTERAVRRIFAAVLDLPVDQIGADDPFLDLGGHSLAAARLCAAVGAELGVALPLADFLAAPTVSGVAAALGTGAATTRPAPVRHEGTATYPLTPVQRDLWTLRTISATPNATTVAVRYRLRGKWLAERPGVPLATALDALVRRHEVLRTTFREQGGAVLATVTAPADVTPVPVAIHDFTGSPDGVRQAERACADAPREPLDLAGPAPLLHATLAVLDHDTAELTLVSDHIAFDGGSAGIVLTDLAGDLADALADRPSTVADPAVQHGDLALRPADPDQDRLRAFWRDELAGAIAPHELSTRDAHGLDTFAGRRLTIPVDPGLMVAVRAFAAAHGSTEFAVTMTALGALVAGLTGRADVLLGSTVADRAHPAVGRTVGPLVDVLPIRLRLTGGQSVRDAVRATAGTTVRALDHQGLAAQDLLDLAGPDRVAGRMLTPVVLSHQPADVPLSATRDDVTVQMLGDVGSDGTQNPLTVFVNATADGTQLQVEYGLDHFDEASAALFAARFVHTLTALIGDPDRPLSTVPVTGADELDRLLAAGTGPALPADAPSTVIDAVLRHEPTRTATVGPDGETLDYAALDRHSARVAAGLLALGVRRGDVVGVCLPRDHALPAILLGVLRAGAAYLPMDPEHPAARLELLVEDAGAACVLAHGDTLAAARQVTTVPVHDATALPASDLPLPEVAPGDLAYVLYTSGSTGTPKGVEVSHANLAAFAVSQQDFPGIGADDVMLAVAPLTFDTSGEEIWSPLAAGGCCVLVERDCAIDGHALADRLASTGATLVELTPTSLRMLLAAGWTGDPGLRVWAGGEALDRALVRELLPRVGALYNSYGPTEATITSAVHRVGPRDAEGSGPVPIGAPIAGERLLVVDELGRVVPPGVTGELWIGGAGVAVGYRGDAERTAKTFVDGPHGTGRCYRTGDLARWRADGRLEFLGRRDHQVKVRGNRVELGEVEAALHEHPHVRDAVVLVTGSGHTAALAAFVVAPGATAAEVRDWLATRLPPHLVPHQWTLSDRLPTLPSGKVDRNALAGLPVRPATTGQAPRTAAEKLVAAAWTAVLDVPSVVVQDNFFALGGHSYAATLVAGRLRAALGAPVTVRTLFDHPVLADLAAALPSPVDVMTEPVVAPANSLSSAQLRIWLACQVDPDGTGYHSPTVLSLRGPLDRQALLAAARDLADRHPVLRSAITATADDTVLAPLPASAVPVVTKSLARNELDAAVTAEIGRPFDLEHEPPMRVALFPVADDEHVLVLTFHHIAVDAQSEQLLVTELGALYRARVGGSSVPPAANPVVPESPVPDAELDWWQDRLTGLPELLALPTDRPRPSVADWASGEVAVTLDPALVDKLRTVAESSGCSLFMVLLAGWQALLARLTGHTDLAVGVPESGRHRAGSEDAIGFFVNTVVLRTDLSGEPTVRDLLARVRDTALDAFAHAAVPFDHVVRRLSPDRSLATTPVFQTMLNVLDQPATAADFGAVTATPEHVRSATAQFDLSIDLRAEHDGYTGELTYRAELFDADTVRRWARWYVRLLDQFADLDRPVLALDPLDDADRAMVLTAGTGHPLLADRPPTVPHAVLAAARRAPHARAVSTRDGELDYAGLRSDACRIAVELVAHGVRRGDVVAVCLPRDHHLPAALLAVWLAGAAYLPLDPEHPVDRSALVIRDAGAVVVLGRTATMASATAAADVARISVLNADLASGVDGMDGVDGALPPLPEPDDLAYVLYTSGSTGKPKGVEVRHRNLAALTAAMHHEPGLTEHDVMTAVAPLTFDASASELWCPLTAGARCEIVERECAVDGPALAARIAASGATVVDLPPTMLRMLLAAGWPGDPALRVFTGGETLDPALAAAVVPLVAELWNMYGPTEATITATIHRVDPKPAGTVPIGHPVAGATARVLDAAGRPALPGTVGELVIGGAGVAAGYRGLPELTARKFDAAGYHTGDLVRLRHGRLEFCGRRDDQVKVRGHRIELGEVESALREHPAVADVAVTARTGGDEHLAAYVVLRGGGLDEVKTFARDRLPGYLVPSRWMTLDRLPRTTADKVDRAALPEPEAPGHEFVAPATAMQELIAALWTDALQVERTGATDNFFELGGHSLAATRVVTRLRDALDCVVPVRLLFEHPVLADFACAVEEVALAAMTEPDQPTETTGMPR